MLENLIRKMYFGKTIVASSLLASLYSCGDTIINNYYGSDIRANETVISNEITDNYSDSSSLSETPAPKISCIGDLEDSILEGENKNYQFKNKIYTITLSYVDTERCKFIIDGKTTDSIKKKENYTLIEGAIICVKDILYQAYAGGVHACEFTFSGGKGVGKIETPDAQ